MAYYDLIARQWHSATGHRGGAFKDGVLNEKVLSRIPGIEGSSILELGAGNGYFLRLVLRRFSSQVPSRIVVSDMSKRLLAIAETHFRIPNAEYRLVDVRQPFRFENESFDLLLASMVFNEVPSGGFKNALKECHRVLSATGLLLIAVIHPKFVHSLQKRQLLTRVQGGGLTMPGAGNLRLPVVIRSEEHYRAGLLQAGFQFQEEDVFPTTEVLNAKSGLRQAGKVPLAKVFHCWKT